MRQNAYKDILTFFKKLHPNVGGHPLRRLEILSSLVFSCLKSKHCSVEKLSQSNGQSKTEQKNSLLQQTKRWLSSKWTDWEFHYLPFAHHFLKKIAAKGELTLVIDGTQIGTCHTALMLCVLWHSHAIPLCWLVKKGQKGHFTEQMHLDLLEMIAPHVPQDTRVVILGDGEFDGENWLKWLNEHNWEFVMRTACDRKVDCGQQEIDRIDRFSPPKGSEYFFAPHALPYAHAICWHKKRFKDPIFLLTNMDLAPMACRYYQRRFKIETLFKQIKSSGFQIHKTRLQQANKIHNLLIVVAIAFVFAYVLGYFLKKNAPQNFVKTFVLHHKFRHMDCFLLALRCWENKPAFVIRFFSDLSKNFDWVFT